MECQKIFISVIQTMHLSNDVYFQNNNLRLENQGPTDIRKKIKHMLYTYFLVKKVNFSTAITILGLTTHKPMQPAAILY